MKVKAYKQKTEILKDLLQEAKTFFKKDEDNIYEVPLSFFLGYIKAKENNYHGREKEEIKDYYNSLKDLIGTKEIQKMVLYVY